jgi:predicted transposase/invertase (TIGR01784 family)
MFANTIEKVRKEGIEKEKIANARKMFHKGFALDMIAEITELSIEELRKILHK